MRNCALSDKLNAPYTETNLGIMSSLMAEKMAAMNTVRSVSIFFGMGARGGGGVKMGVVLLMTLDFEGQKKLNIEAVFGSTHACQCVG